MKCLEVWDWFCHTFLLRLIHGESLALKIKVFRCAKILNAYPVFSLLVCAAEND